MPAGQAIPDGDHPDQNPGAGNGCLASECDRPESGQILQPTVERLDEIPRISALTAQVIIAGVGLEMRCFPTSDHLVSRAKLCPRTIPSRSKTGSGKAGKGNPYLKGVLGRVAATAARTDTFLGERYRRIVKRRGQLKALVAVARSILVIIWHLLADPTLTYRELGADHYTNRLDTGKKVRNYMGQLEALSFTVTLATA